jgi:hypothetical protein
MEGSRETSQLSQEDKTAFWIHNFHHQKAPGEAKYVQSRHFY